MTEQNAVLAEKLAELEQRLAEQADESQANEMRINQLESEKKTLEIDLNKIMGNLTRW